MKLDLNSGWKLVHEGCYLTLSLDFEFKPAETQCVRHFWGSISDFFLIQTVSGGFFLHMKVTSVPPALTTGEKTWDMVPGSEQVDTVWHFSDEVWGICWLHAVCEVSVYLRVHLSDQLTHAHTHKHASLWESLKWIIRDGFYLLKHDGKQRLFKIRVLMWYCFF